MGVLDGDMLVSFDIINMFPSIDNKTGVERIRSKLIEVSDRLNLPVECIIEALEICLTKNCSAYREQYWLHRDYFMVGECVRFLFTSCEGSLNERVSAANE